tara:strand:- start:18922 stop:19167 length:246 start_codon:yes stop_codon:yes gene_type:complete
MPSTVPANLYLDIIAVAFPIPSQDIQDNVFASQFTGFDIRVQNINRHNIRKIRAQIINQVHQQIRGFCKQTLENVIVGRIE